MIYEYKNVNKVFTNNFSRSFTINKYFDILFIYFNMFRSIIEHHQDCKIKKIYYKNDKLKLCYT